MKKIRRVFLLLAVVILVALALLVQRALAAAAAERAARHQALAERAGDEMERELSNFLDREEERPFEHYRHVYLPASGEPILSPLAGAPQSFVLGYFQILPDDTVASPHIPGPGDIALGAADAAPGVQTWMDHFTEVVRLVWQLPSAGELELNASQVMGTTVELGKAKKRPPPLAYENLQELNRGAQQRSQRLSKIASIQVSNVVMESDTSQIEREVQALREQLERSAETDVVAVRLEPMVSRSPHPGTLVLYRTVEVGGAVYRQGLLINTEKLVEHLAAQVVSGKLARSMTIEVASPEVASQEAASQEAASQEATQPEDDHVFVHRFAEPFGEVAALVRMAPLPEVSATFWIYAFSTLLALASTVGLFAVYKMVAVVVDFAERRQGFVSAVTHELKTPLTSIRMYGEMLRDGAVPDEAKRQHYYRTITAEAERLTRLLQNVLELARLEKGERPMSFAVGPVEGILDDVVDVLGPHAAKLGFNLRLDIEPDLPEVRYDRDALLQVMLNLVDNALKYSKDATDKEVVLGCHRLGDGVALTVTDHGPGVAREHLGKIFEPFYRGEDEMTRRTKGTGIGLSLVLGLVESMQGKVSSRNLKNGGFEVQVSFAA